MRMLFVVLVAGLAFLCHFLSAAPAEQDFSAGLEEAVKAASAKVAPSIVQVETSGGNESLGGGRGVDVRKGTGPTTGVIVSPDGYVISSAFNFASRPSAIFVAVPGQKERFVAKLVATDHSRMLTLLKIDAKGLPVPQAAPKSELRVGQSVVALGRTWSSLDSPPSMAVGILSALGRIWGKAVQTDAKTSPVNYGGPLVDLRGRVVGVIVPASPRGQDDTAGVEWYDSGIGFAVPLEDIFTVLPRLMKGQDLRKGLLGITLESTDIYVAKPTIAQVSPESAAAKAGIESGDVIVQINNVAISRQAQMMHALGDKYEGDKISLKVKRKDKELSFDNVQLVGLVDAYAHPSLGILPMRDEAEAGEEIRYVFPGSAAEKAGLKPGDRLLAIGAGSTPRMQPIADRDQFVAILNRLPSQTEAGLELKLDVKRKDGKKETISLKPLAMPDVIPANLPEPASRKQALRHRAAQAAKDKEEEKKEPKPPGVEKKEEDKKDPKSPMPEKKDQKKEPKPPIAEKKPEVGTLERLSATQDRKYWLYVPEEYDPNIAHALVIWLHPAGRGGARDIEAMLELWQEICDEYNVIVLAPVAENPAGWLASEVEEIQQIVREVQSEYTIDDQRVVAHGMGQGGQMAFYLGFQARNLIRGVAAVGAPLSGEPKETRPDQRLAFYLAGGSKDPALPGIQETRTKLKEKRYPIHFREMAGQSHQYLNGEGLAELARWIDSLDRQ